MIANVLATSILLAASAAASPSATPTEQPAQHAAAVDPCALLSASDVQSALHAAAPTPQRPSANECLWAAAAHAPAGTAGGMSQLLVTVDSAQAAKRGCRGLGCLSLVQSVAGVIPGADRFSNALNEAAGAAGTVQEISGLGERAGWTNGVLVVLRDAVILKVQLTGTAAGGNALALSEVVARSALGRF